MTLTEGIQTLMSIQKYQRFSILDNVSKASYMYRCRLQTFLRLLSLKINKRRWKLKKKWIIKKLHIVCNKVVVWNVQFTFTPWWFVSILIKLMSSIFRKSLSQKWHGSYSKFDVWELQYSTSTWRYLANNRTKLCYNRYQIQHSLASSWSSETI